MTAAQFVRPDTGATVDQDYRYDAWGRLVGVDVNGDEVFTDSADQIHEYDALNRRIQTTVGNVTTTDFYHSAAWQVLEERSRGSTDAESAGVLKARYVWSPGYVDSLLLRDADLDGDGNVTDANERHYVQQDANFNVTSIVDRTGAVVERYGYDPYGNRTVLDANFAPDADGVSDVGLLYGHQGGRHDVATWLVHFRNRDLQVLLGRWNREDPSGYSDGMSAYQAMQSNLPSSLDFDGLITRGPGHHIVPFSLFVDADGNLLVPEPVAAILNGDGARIHTDGYTKHNRKNYGGVKESEYRKAVSDMLDEFLSERGRKKCNMTHLDAIEFLDKITTQPDDSTIGKYLRGVEDELDAELLEKKRIRADETPEDRARRRSRWRAGRLTLAAGAMFSGFLVSSAGAAKGVADNKFFSLWIKGIVDLHDKKIKCGINGDEIRRVVYGPYYKSMLEHMPSYVGDATDQSFPMVLASDIFVQWMAKVAERSLRRGIYED